jgi:hypothetical protein
MAFQHRHLMESVAGDDSRVVFKFFIVFSRFECALKRSGFAKGDRFGSAMADWDKFGVDVLDPQFANGNSPEFTQAKEYLLQSPPRKQAVSKADQSMKWVENPRRPKESDGQYLLRLVRDVRNNLFHGGKYPVTGGGPVDGQRLRNAKLLRACMEVLDHCCSLDGNVNHVFEEEP